MYTMVKCLKDEWAHLFLPNACVVVVVIVVVKAYRQERKCSRLAPGYFTLNGDKAPPATRDRSEVARS